jgi:hypothetical protein
MVNGEGECMNEKQKRKEKKERKHTAREVGGLASIGLTLGAVSSMDGALGGAGSLTVSTMVAI